MTKRKHPTKKSLRQGQTVYLVSKVHRRSWNDPEEVFRYFLYSHKTPLPEPGCIIEKMPVSLLREKMHIWGAENIFYSRRRAETECNRRNGL